MMAIVVIGRFLVIFLVFYAFALCFRVRKLYFKEVLYLSWAGNVRGSVAFALAYNIPHKCPDGNVCLDQKNTDLLQSSALIIVMATTIFFGNFMRVANNFMLDHRCPELTGE